MKQGLKVWIIAGLTGMTVTMFGLLLSGCGRGGSDSDSTPPTVSSTNPADGAAGVAISTTISATFSETMNDMTLTPATVTVSTGGSNIAGTVSYSGATVSFTPAAALAENAPYTAMITTGATDSAGNALSANYTWNFTTGPASDSAPPTVISTDPADGTIEVAVNTTISATFSEAMNDTTLTPATVTVSRGAGAIAGTVSYSDTTVTFTPSGNLSYNTFYTATITTGVKDLTGNAMAADYQWSFMTKPAPGKLDAAFNATGKVTTPIGSGDDQAYAVVLQPDGKIIAAGYAFNGASKDFAVARYNADGTLDTAFNATGILTTPIGSGDDQAYAVALQPDGKIIAVGNAFGASKDFAVARYNTDGALDPTFNATGIVITPIGSSVDEAHAVALQPDGKIVVAGFTFGASYDFAVARYNTDGALDPTFNTTGIVKTPIGSAGDYAYSVAVQPDGKIVAAGYAFNGARYDFAVARYNTDGALDPTFNATGIVTTPIGSGDAEAYAVALQPDGKIVAAGFTFGVSIDFAVARYNTDGTLDTAFNSTGMVTTPIGPNADEGYAVALQPDGKIVVAGFAFISANYDFAVARYNADGTLDTAFNSTGMVTTPIGTAADEAYAVALQPDGKIVAVGNAFGANKDFAVVRYWP